LVAVATPAGCLAGDAQARSHGRTELRDRRVEFAEHRLQRVAVAVEAVEQESFIKLGRRGVPAAPEGVVDGPFQLRAEPEVAEWSAGAEVPADRAGVEVVDRVRAELRLDVAADLVQVDAEGGQQRGGVEAGPVAAAGADDEPDRVAGSLGGEAVLGEQPRCFGCLREGEADQQVFQADVAMPGEFGLTAGRGQDRADRSRRPRCGRYSATGPTRPGLRPTPAPLRARPGSAACRASAGERACHVCVGFRSRWIAWEISTGACSRVITLSASVQRGR